MSLDTSHILLGKGRANLTTPEPAVEQAVRLGNYSQLISLLKKCTSVGKNAEAEIQLAELACVIHGTIEHARKVQELIQPFRSRNYARATTPALLRGEPLNINPTSLAVALGKLDIAAFYLVQGYIPKTARTIAGEPLTYLHQHAVAEIQSALGLTKTENNMRNILVYAFRETQLHPSVFQLLANEIEEHPHTLGISAFAPHYPRIKTGLLNQASNQPLTPQANQWLTDCVKVFLKLQTKAQAKQQRV